MSHPSFGQVLEDMLESQWHALQLGDLSLYLMKKHDAYWVAVDYQPAEQPFLEEPLRPVDSLPAHVEVKEKLYLAEIPYLTLQLADKPYQVNPATDVKIASKSRLVLYVSTPLWLQLRSPANDQVLAEYPTVSPRLSWVGVNTTEGSLCYSTRTSAPSVLSEVKLYPHRAITALELINDGEQLLTIDRLSLPLNILGLYRSERSGYWTESVRYRINPSTGDTTVVAAPKPPEELGEVVTIAEARNTNKTSRFRTAMNLIMG